jgi:hypothetical protein
LGAGLASPARSEAPPFPCDGPLPSRRLLLSAGRPTDSLICRHMRPVLCASSPVSAFFFSISAAFSLLCISPPVLPSVSPLLKPSAFACLHACLSKPQLLPLSASVSGPAPRRPLDRPPPASATNQHPDSLHPLPLLSSSPLARLGPHDGAGRWSSASRFCLWRPAVFPRPQIRPSLALSPSSPVPLSGFSLSLSLSRSRARVCDVCPRVLPPFRALIWQGEGRMAARVWSMRGQDGVRGEAGDPPKCRRNSPFPVLARTALPRAFTAARR